jgi:hypothetical protein
MANPNAAGVPGAEASSFSICMGRLDENQVAGPTVETCLVKIQLADGGAGSTDVTVAPDTLRGGVVGSTFAVTSVYEDGAFTQVNFTAPICYTGPQLAQWQAVGEPDCWCSSVNPYQCHGDADGLGEGKGNYHVSSNDLNTLLAAWNKNFAAIDGLDYNGIPLICADSDHLPEGKGAYRVSSNDLNTLLWYWNNKNGAVPADCP